MMKNKTYLICFCLTVGLVVWPLVGFSPVYGQNDPGSESEPAAESMAVSGPETGDELTHDHETEVAVTQEEESSGPPGLTYFLFSGKYLAFLIMAAAGLTLLLVRWVKLWIRIGMLVIAFVLFGLDFSFLFPLHPSPMCAVTNLFIFKFTYGVFFPALLAAFLAIMAPCLIGRKLFCGWVCPLGAFQDLINKIPFKPRWKQFNFTAFNSVRMVLLGMFFLTFFWVKDQVLTLSGELGVISPGGLWNAYAAYSVYEPINFFELLHWQVDTVFIIMMAALIIASLMLYRPFCYSICPIGALTWLLEKIAPGRIRVDMNKCTECGTCDEESPCPTIRPLRLGTARLLPDCTSCGECIKTCPEDAISFKFTK